jgi:hypothetical protein
MNAPDTTSIGKIDINVTKPQSFTRPKTAEQIAAAGDAGGIDLAGWEHELRGKDGRFLSRGMSARDRAAIHRAHQRTAREARREDNARAGTHAHAEELRRLGHEASGLSGGNAFLRTSVAGGDYMPRDALRAMGGNPSGLGVRAPVYQNALFRAAKMIDSGQPSLARLHAPAIRAGATEEGHMSPEFAARLSAAAAKLESLAPGRGLAAQPPSTPQFRARTAAARRYAASTITAAGDLTTAVELAGPYRYRHGWIKIAPGQADAVRATASRLEAGGHDPGAARAALHLRQAAGIMDQGELSERAHEEARTHLSQAADLRPDIGSEVSRHMSALDTARPGPPQPSGGHMPYDRDPDVPLNTSLGKLNLFGRVLPTIQAAGEPLDPIDLGFHFDPGEHRDKGGRWTKADTEAIISHVEGLRQKGDDAYGKRYRGSEPYSRSRRDAASFQSELRAGNWHKAADHLDAVASQYSLSTPHGKPPRELQQLHDAARKIRTSAVYDPAYTHGMEKEVYGQAVTMSADTGRLATTPHPFGKPGGPGLWGVKGMELPPYVQNIAHALLRTGRAKDEGQAIAMARAATKRWLHGKNVHPEVRAAAAGADADWRAKQATAHAHSNTELARRVLELTGTAAGAAQDQRNVLGQFGTGGQAPAKGGKQPVKGGKPPAKGKPSAHQQHLAHLKSVAQKKAGLLSQARADRTRANALIAQRNSMMKALASAGGKVSSGQAGAKTAANATTKSTAAAATTASTAATAAKSTAATAGKATAAAASVSKMSTSQLKAGIARLNAQITQLQSQAAALAAQAAKLK